MNELIMPHNIGVKNALENMKEVLALYKKVIGNYRPLLDGERYLTDREVAQILKVSRRTLQEYRNDGVLPYILLGGKVLVAVDNLQGYVHQLHLEGNIGLVALADDPLVAIDVHNVVRCQVLHIDERDGCEADFGCKTTISFGIHRYAKCSSLRNKKRAVNRR